MADAWVCVRSPACRLPKPRHCASLRVGDVAHRAPDLRELTLGSRRVSYTSPLRLPFLNIEKHRTLFSLLGDLTIIDDGVF